MPDPKINSNYQTANLKDLTERGGHLFKTNELQVADELRRLGMETPMLHDYSLMQPGVTVKDKRPNHAEGIDNVMLGAMALGTAVPTVVAATDAAAASGLGQAFNWGRRTGDWIPFMEHGVKAGADITGGLVGGHAVNSASKYITGNDWDTNVQNTIKKHTGVQVPKMLVDMTNPGYYLGGIPVYNLTKNWPKHIDNFGRRAVETFMRTTPEANPLGDVRKGIKSMIKGKDGGGKRLLDIGKYWFTGKKTGEKGWYNSFAPKGHYYGGITDPLVTDGFYRSGETPDLIDAGLYGETIDPAFGFKKIDNTGDFSIHNDYIKSEKPLYKEKANDIQIYDSDLSNIDPSDVDIKDTHAVRKSIYSSTGKVDAAGHLEALGVQKGTNNPVDMEQDVWKFDPEDYVGNWLSKNQENINKDIEINKMRLKAKRSGAPVVYSYKTILKNILKAEAQKPLLRAKMVPLKGGLHVTNHYVTPVITRRV